MASVLRPLLGAFICSTVLAGPAFAQLEFTMSVGDWWLSGGVSESSGMFQCVATIKGAKGPEAESAGAGVLFFQGELDDIGTPVFRLPILLAPDEGQVWADVAVDGTMIGSGEFVSGDNSDFYLDRPFQTLRAMGRGQVMEVTLSGANGTLGSWSFDLTGFVDAYAEVARACGADPKPVLMGL